ncbi:Putative multicopper oxidase, type 1, multicopper oxidase, copper-binding, cupredoxin [Septoria linicola]|uniref:Multicopper oxidase, type 1, multicopper oxidase, copper-binding, cupredoxin n=1 Tax=Septoria linicola TaxID=215465 RepID=A0A9Q9AHQ7_9PEZI|nr:putative multicopper oxidase, type 1, multicopper oxidase, copper-binding, cupredoxin [Septoria linicola]USW47934.1 Putative multicopper oxidase, type 1, multicopper oxidase, copper-binding, cupredoxin [Septoria linicola]
MWSIALGLLSLSPLLQCFSYGIAYSLPCVEQRLGVASQPQSDARRATRFEIELTTQSVNPAGIGSRQAIFINNTFVGPTLYAKQGDQIEFLVHNYMQQDTSIHFHGIDQRSSPWSDGVPGLTQAHIKPGASFLYNWTAHEAGTYFYHSHAKAQMMDGLYGAIVISPEENAKRPFHLLGDGTDVAAMLKAEEVMQPIFVSDWTQYTSSEYHEIQHAANIDFSCMDAILINGVGSQYCLSETELDSMTNPLVLQLLKELAGGHMTPKGCIPPLQMFNGDFDLHLENVPELAYEKCVGGRSAKGNYTIDVDSRLGWAALTFINPGGLYPLQLSIDNHEMHIYAVDGQYVHPITADRILVNAGSRISVMIKLDQERAKFAIRIANDYLNQILGGFAELAYDGATNEPKHPKPKTNYGGKPLSSEVRSFVSEDSRPFPAAKPAEHADATFKLRLKKLGQPYGAYEWTQTGHLGYNISHEHDSPALLLQDPSQITSSELILKTQLGDWVDLVLVTAGPFAQAHPMHKHGNKVFLIGSGTGSFPWDNVEEALPHLPEGTFNLEDPPYLDTFNTVEMEGQANDTWTAVRYRAEYAGAWLFHCHVQTHLSGGMGMVILDGVDEWPEVPVAYREWNGFEPPSVE